MNRFIFSHPTLRSTQSTHVSTPPSTSQHLHPQFLFSTSDETPLRMNSIISKPSGYPSKTLDPLTQRSPWSTSIDQPSSKKQEDPTPGSSHPNWNPPHSRSSSPPIQDHQSQTDPLACTETRNQDTHQDTHQDPNRDEIDFKIDKRLTEASTLLWNENGNGNEGSDGCSNLNLNGESVDRNSDQWKQHRKNNHKEVERRRRETINEGITELKKIVPGSEKNKGEILKQAVRYIQRLKSMEIEDQEKWRLERMRMEGRMKDQSEEIERLSRECLSLEVENESLKRWIIDLGERSRSDLPQLSIDHSIRTSQSQSSSDELNRIDLPLHESSIMRNQTRDRAHDAQHQDTEDNLHHLLRTATEEFGMKRSKESIDDEDEPDRSNYTKKSKS
ncbi:hypothetical protein DFH28DRAFT_1092889 [Melampsora americana]|nr:hypothetical protein DFH28DRAFT_1092889 [Melampsora americana]